MWIARFWPAQDVAPSAEASLRSRRLNALSTCRLCPCTRLKNRRFICRLYFVFGHAHQGRPNRGMSLTFGHARQGRPNG